MTLSIIGGAIMSNEESNEIVENSEGIEKPDQGGQTNDDANDRYKRDMLRYKQDLKAQKDANDALQKQIESLKQQSLQEKENYKELWQLEKEKSETLARNLDESANAFFSTLRDQEIEKEALKFGITKEGLEDLKLVDKSGVITERTDQGNVNILGASEFIESLKARRPGWFSQQGAPRTNNANPGFAGEKTYTASDILKLQRENPDEYKRIMSKNLKK